MRSRDIDATADGFTMRSEVIYKQGDISFVTVSTASGDADGQVHYAIDGRAQTSFQFAKVGLNIHHPVAGLAGREWRGRTPGGPAAGMLSQRVQPQIHLRDDGWDLPMFSPVYKLWLEHEVGTLELDFGGDLYEMEDQRNWGDQSFKTCSMPAFLGYRHSIAAGEHHVERIRLTFSPNATSPRTRRARGGDHARRRATKDRRADWTCDAFSGRDPRRTSERRGFRAAGGVAPGASPDRGRSIGSLLAPTPRGRARAV